MTKHSRWLPWVLMLGLQASVSHGEEPRPRTLLISLDAVPFWVVDDLTNPALGNAVSFKGFKGPVPLVSTFPSSTSVALVGLLQPLGLERSPGYEARFFDWEKLEVRGGGMVSYSKIDFPWRDFFDWSRKSPTGSAFEAVKPVKSGIKRLRRAIDEFVSTEVDVSLIYIAATDTAVHVVGPESVKRLLIELDAMIEEAKSRRPDRPFETVIFSDHGVAGGEPLINVSKATKKALRSAGYRVSKKLVRPDAVAMTPFGLVSNFEAYTHEEHKPEVARILSGVEGVDLCVFEEGTAQWRVMGPSGGARFARDDSQLPRRWRYEAEGGDPLGYAAIVDRLVIATPQSAGWVEDEELFQATKGHQFPDALHRLADAFALVSNPASVVCSLASQYMYGAGSTAALATVGKGKLRWTHGSLDRAATMGFLLSDAAAWVPPDVARYDRALLPFRKDLSRHANVSDPISKTSSD